jgi:endonuclease V-like protein UPF0215 family
MQFRAIKKEIRILAWDDGPFKFRSRGKDILVGVIFRGGQFMDGLLKTEVEIDGHDATERIVDKILKTRHKDIRIVMLDGITFAGFNTVDIKKVHDRTGLPVIVVNRKKPNLERFMKTLKGMPYSEERLKAVRHAGPLYSVNVKNKRVYLQSYGIERKDVKEIIKTTSTNSVMPEPLRAAHLIANGFILGESVGRA